MPQHPSEPEDPSMSPLDLRNQEALELIEEQKLRNRGGKTVYGKGKPRPPAAKPPPPGSGVEVKNPRRYLLGEMAGYFRGAEESEQEGAGNAIEKAMLIGIAYGQMGQPGAGKAVALLGVPDRYLKAILDTLEGRD